MKLFGSTQFAKGCLIFFCWHTKKHNTDKWGFFLAAQILLSHLKTFGKIGKQMQDTDIFIQVTHDLKRIWKAWSLLVLRLSVDVTICHPHFAVFWYKYSQNTRACTRDKMTSVYNITPVTKQNMNFFLQNLWLLQTPLVLTTRKKTPHPYFQTRKTRICICFFGSNLYLTVS